MARSPRLSPPPDSPIRWVLGMLAALAVPFIVGAGLVIAEAVNCTVDDALVVASLLGIIVVPAILGTLVVTGVVFLAWHPTRLPLRRWTLGCLIVSALIVAPLIVQSTLTREGPPACHVRL